MREISDAEARVVAGELAGLPTRDSVGQSVPLRTYQEVRRRLTQRDCLYSRYVPSPVALRRPLLLLALTRPFLEHHRETGLLWAARPEAVDIREGRESIFGAFLLADQSHADSLRVDLDEPVTAQATAVVVCDLRRATVPVYFDFDGAWRRITHQPESPSYPQTLPDPQPEASSNSTGRDAAVVRTLLLASAVHSNRETDILRRQEKNPHQLGRAFRRGLVRHRTFLEPTGFASWATGFPNQMVWVHGKLQSRAVPGDLWRELVWEGGLRPFLFAFDGEAVLMGFLSGAPPAGAYTKQPKPAAPDAVFRTHLRRTMVSREPLISVRPLLAHRFDRPFANED